MSILFVHLERAYMEPDPTRKQALLKRAMRAKIGAREALEDLVREAREQQQRRTS